MNLVPIGEFVDRVERLFTLFPDHMHIMRADYAEYNRGELREMCRKKGIICKYNDYGEYTEKDLYDLAWENHVFWIGRDRFVFTLAKSKKRGKGIVEYFQRVCLELSDEIFYIVETSAVGVHVYGMKIYADVSLDNPFLPKIQVDILNAIHGKSWVNYYKFEISHGGLLTIPILEKIA